VSGWQRGGPVNFEIPVVETQRLVLRAFRNEDLDAFAAMSADAEVMRFIGNGDTVDRNGSWRSMAVFNGHWSLRGFGMWAIERKSDGMFIGRTGLHRPPYWPDLEAGWLLSRDSWGQGFAREGAAAVLAFARSALPQQRLVSYIRPGNQRSVDVAVALGATHEGAADLLGTPVEVYVHGHPSAG
jgi:RimJ/RimL family protein N-acetyltransferase